MVTVYVQEYDGKAWQYVAVQLDTDEDFTIDESDLNGELCNIGVLVVKYGEVQAKLRAQFARMKARVELTESELAQKLRANPPSGTKLTENSINETVKTDPSYQQVLAQSIQTEQDSTMADNFFKGIMKKSDALISLTYFKREEFKRI